MESMRSGGGIPPPPQKGYLSDTCAIPFESKANGCDTPLCDTVSRRYGAICGGVSRTGPLRQGPCALSCLVCSFSFLRVDLGGDGKIRQAPLTRRGGFSANHLDTFPLKPRALSARSAQKIHGTILQQQGCRGGVAFQFTGGLRSRARKP